MQVRRVVTGHDAGGQPVFISDDNTPRAADFADIPGYGFAQLWSTEYPSTTTATDDPTAARGSLIPGTGGTSMLMVSLPPDSVMAQPRNPERAFAQMAEELPGLLECFDPERPGMHKTPTVDYGVLLEGELWLELEGGESRVLHPGDVVIQNGTSHAWRNRSDQPAKAVFFMQGAIV
ncbi:cupin domain-containing protein [Marinobacterium lutimaris]|uniref:Cupin domain-containing protein n=1 Tax=Marinobacterium lutimaris TaxID=568106 RepID=A0A1H6DTX1_9GAMM|nr:cupin domain-containing protein [Marinobacterium lutimaris]SEG88183.1 Cupin domain-containing protein [Marinobacterium lutimaris]